jgi:hypothetical protein
LDLEIFNFLILDLCKKIINYNFEIKAGLIQNIIKETDKIINNYSDKHSFLEKIIVSDQNYGLNLELSGLTSKFLFPSFLYKNSFRLHIIRQLEKILSNKHLDKEELGIFLYKHSIKTIDIKKGGFSKRTLEVLRFYLSNFDKIIDNDLNKFLPYLNDYNSKYIKLKLSTLQKRFHLTQKYSTYYLLPNFNIFGLNSVFLTYDEFLDSYFGEIHGVLLGLLFDNSKNKQFLLLFSPYLSQLKPNFIKKISFYENLDLFHKNADQSKYQNKVNSIFDLYYDFKDKEFKNSAVSFEVHFFNKKSFRNQQTDIDLLIHLFNTRKLPINHQSHPLSKQFYSYRNKVVNFFGSTNYFIYIFDSTGKSISSISETITILIKNTFSNGYIIQFNSGFFISTFLFKKDFDQQKTLFIDFFHSFKLEILIYESLNFIPFSFYQISNSTYFNIENGNWSFPLFSDQDISEQMRYQLKNLEKEKKRLEDQAFNLRVNKFLNNWKDEINALKI